MIEGLLNIRNLLTLQGQSGDALLLKSGTVVKAQVIDVSEDGNALLRLLLSGGKNMQGTVIRAKSEIPLQKGQNIFLEISGGRNNLKMRFVADSEGASQPVTGNMPAKALDVLAQLSNARLSNSEFKLFLDLMKALPRSVREALPELKNLETLWDSRQLDGKLIKAFVEKSGITFETKITIALLKDPGQILQSLLALQTEGDFKSLLLTLRKLLGDRSVSAALRQAGFKGAELSKTVERFLDSIEFYQLTSKLNDMLYTFLPILWDGLHDGELMFRKNKGPRSNSYTCDINLDLESLGRLSVSIRITDRQFFVSFFTDSEETERLIHSHRHLLQERFSSQGLQLKALNLTRKREISFGQSHLKGVNVKI